MAALMALGMHGQPQAIRADELAARDAWVARHMGRPAKGAAHSSGDSEPSAGLLVAMNHGPILRNGRPDGRRIKLADTEYSHGLICHAPSRLIVSLPAPGARFEARVGVDTHAGGGSVVFAVRAGGSEAFRSSVLRGGEPGVQVSVALGEARTFTLEASDAGDGISSDHADWADAVVTLTDGRTLRLSDMPEIGVGVTQRACVSPPFTFTYGGRSSDELLPTWKHRRTTSRLDRDRVRTVDTYSDPVTRLEVRCDTVTYVAYPTVEWTVYVRNRGKGNSKLIAGLRALDSEILAPSGEAVLHRFVGSPCREDDYRPMEEELAAGRAVRVAAAGGRPTNSDLCYFNVDGGREGVVMALGWPGQWAATFERRSEGIRVAAGQETTLLVLHPGEEIRAPLVALQFYRGRDWLDAQNVWRRWMVAHNLPRPAGKPIAPHYGGCWGNVLPRADEEIAQIRGIAADGVKLDYWFIDAGWYPCAGSWVNTGTWEPDPQRFPRGLAEVGEVLRQSGIGFIVWFEPERVTPGSWLAEHRPEWVLGGARGGLFHMGHPEARRWMTDRVDTLMKAGHVDVFRTDFNMDPLPYWQAHDADDRIGMTENAYVVGLLAFWDELLSRGRGRWMDTCASGGRRNDLETLRRAVPLLRSDWAVVRFDREGAIGQQAQTWGISLWMPYHGTGAPCGDVYAMRSSYAPAFRMGWDSTAPNRDAAKFRAAVAEFRRVAPYMLGDFHPLTSYSLSPDEWIAWQYDRPDLGEGAVQAFRRAHCTDAVRVFRLRGLEPQAVYEVENLDGGPLLRLKGQELMEAGLTIRIEDQPGSAVLLYRKERPRMP